MNHLFTPIVPPRRLSRVAAWLVALVLAWLVAATNAGPAEPVVTTSVVPAAAEAATASSPRIGPKVAPRLLRELEASGEADVLVFVRGRPDLTPARSLTTKQARGRFVVEALWRTAVRTQAGLRKWLDARGAEYQAFWIVNMLRVRADQELVAELARRAEVEKIDINIRLPGLSPLSLDKSHLRDATRPTSMSAPTFAHSPIATPTATTTPTPTSTPTPPWGIVGIGAPAVWERGIRGQGIVVAGNDTGVDWDHKALIGAYRGWDGQSADHNYNWHDAWAKTPLEPSDDQGHGTHTIGTVIGGGPSRIGVAPEAKWIACRNMNNGWGTPASYVDCFQFFLAPTDLGGNDPKPDLAPHVINNSWGCPREEGCFPDDPVWEDTIRPAVEALTEAGIAVVVAAGNAGSACQTVQDPPAIYPESLTVGAVQSDNLIAEFSSRGPITVNGSGLAAPDLAAPGVWVLSSLPGDGYGTSSGTSMAAPHVAGTIALLWSAEPRLIGHLAVTEQVLRASAVPRADPACGGDADGQPNNVYGWGIINADAAVSSAETLQELGGIVTDSGGSPLTGAEVRINDLTWEVEVDLVTGVDGRYSTPLLPGSYRIGVDTPAHFADVAVVMVPEGGPAAHNVTLLTCVDWNSDGLTGAFEVQAAAGDWHSDGSDPEHDVDGDGTIDVVDVAILSAHFDEPCSGLAP